MADQESAETRLAQALREIANLRNQVNRLRREHALLRKENKLLRRGNRTLFLRIEKLGRKNKDAVRTGDDQ